MTDERDKPEPIQLLEMAARLAGIGHWRFDVSSGRIHWSSETYRIHGLPEPEGEPTYQELLNLYAPESAELLASLVARALSTGQGYDLEATIKRPDGAVRHIAAKAECAFEPDGKVVALYGVFQDVTERTQAERFMRALTNYIPGMVAYWDANLRCRFANAQYLEWFGRDPGQMLGVSIQDLMGPDLFRRNEAYIRGAMSGQAQTFERTLVKPSGEIGHTLAQYIPDIDETGRISGMVVLVTDVTPLKEAELLLKQANAAAEQAREEAEAALNVKRDFLSNISHELRNPLTAILGFTELLGEPHSLGAEDTAKQVRLIRDASSDLLRTVNDLLDFAKLEAGKVLINPDRAEPYSIGLHALEFFEPQLRAKGLSHDFTAFGLPPVVMVDYFRTRQILLNLIGNAVKFTTTGGVTLKADYDYSRKILRYVVADTGPGIPEAFQSSLFQRFTQADASHEHQLGGTGLGLAICRGLAEAMGGSVGCVSKIGQGSQFSLELPCEPTDARAAIEPNGQGEASRIGTLQNLRFLVVDDHAVNRQLVRRILEPLGVVVVEAVGGAEAVELANRDLFDVILLDIFMPEVDGPAAARIIRSGSGPSRSARIVAFSASDDRAAAPRWGGLFDAWMSKPFSVSDLVHLLVEHSPASVS
jgi:PAS domain S-box-containing protein